MAGPRSWTADEDATLRSVYPTYMPLDDVVALVPGRSRNAVVARANILGLQRPDPAKGRLDFSATKFATADFSEQDVAVKPALGRVSTLTAHLLAVPGRGGDASLSGGSGRVPVRRP